jgi:hypothetical protein
LNKNKIDSIQARLERLTRKWWFYVIIIVLQFVIPSYAAKGFTPSEIGDLMSSVFPQALINGWAPLYPLFKVIPIILMVLIILIKNRVSRAFSIYVAISYILFAILQNIANTDKYGLAIITTNIFMFLLVSFSWVWESIAGKNDFILPKLPWWRYWVVPLAFLAFWYPLNPEMQPDFNPLLLLTSSAGLAFCLMTPVYIALLTLFYPGVNMVTLRITSFIGIILGLYNMAVNFVFQPDLLWWNGVLHIPLLSISIYGLVLSLRKTAQS